MKIPFSVLNLFRGCDKKEGSRYALRYIDVTREADGTVTAVATDARQLSVVTWLDTESTTPLHA